MTVEHNGKTYARVSEILSGFCDFSNISPEVLKAKADIGTQVHKAIEEAIAGKEPEVSGRVKKYFESWQRWNDHLKPRYVLSESRYYDDTLMITGQIDAVADIDGAGGSMLVDWKTSLRESPTWKMQGHLYLLILKANGIQVENMFLFLRLNDKGKAPMAHIYGYEEETANKCRKAVEDFWVKQNTLPERKGAENQKREEDVTVK